MLSKAHRESIKAYLDIYLPVDKLSKENEIVENLGEFIKYNEILSVIKEHYQLSDDDFATIHQHKNFLTKNLGILEEVIGISGLGTINSALQRIDDYKLDREKQRSEDHISDNMFWQSKALFEYYRRDHIFWKQLQNEDGAKFGDMPTFDEKIPSLGVRLIDIYPYANIVGRDNVVEKAHDLIYDFANQLYKEQKRVLAPFFDFGSEHNKIKSLKRFVWFDLFGKSLPKTDVQRFYSPVMIVEGEYGTGKSEFFNGVKKDLEYILNDYNIGVDIDIGREGNSPKLEIIPAGYSERRHKKKMLIKSLKRNASFAGTAAVVYYLFNMFRAVNERVVSDYDNRGSKGAEGSLGEIDKLAYWKNTDTMRDILRQGLVYDLMTTIVQFTIIGAYFLGYNFLSRKYDKTPKTLARYDKRDNTLAGVPDNNVLLGRSSDNPDDPQNIGLSAIAEAHMKTLNIANLEFYSNDLQAMLGEISEGGQTNFANYTQLHFNPRFVICASTNDYSKVDKSLKSRAETAGLKEKFDKDIPFNRGVTDNHLMMLIKYWTNTNGWIPWDIKALKEYISSCIIDDEKIMIERSTRGTVSFISNFARHRASSEITTDILHKAIERRSEEGKEE